MRRALVVFAGLCILTLSVGVQAGVFTTGYQNPIYSVTVAGTLVDVYRVTQFATDPNGLVGAIVIGIGNDGGTLCTNIGVDPFQVWTRYMSTSFGKSVDQDTVDYYLADPDPNDPENEPEWTDANAPLADSRFLDGILGWSPAVVTPNETNDGNINSAYVQDPPQYDNLKLRLGQGDIYAQVGVPVAYREHSIDLMEVGVIRGTTVAGRAQSADDQGGVYGDTEVFIFGTPEPGTMSLMFLGALAILRRRKRPT